MTRFYDKHSAGDIAMTNRKGIVMCQKPPRTSLFIAFLTLIAATQWQAFAQPVPVIPLTGAVWRHSSNSLDGVDWTAPDYDDSAAPWFEGMSLLSNDTGNGTVAPLIGTFIVGPQVPVDGGPVQHAYYFRTRFNWNPPVMPSLLNVTSRVDDAAVFFLNGNEIFRLRVAPETAIQYDALDFATGLPCGGDVDCDTVFSAPAVGLVQGENVLAAIVYQEGGNSSDVAFGVSVEVLPGAARTPTIVDATEPRDRVVPLNHTAILTVAVDGVPTPNFQWFKDGVAITGATGSNYVISSMQEADVGDYFAVASNFVGTVTSRTASIQFTTDVDPPQVVRALGSATFDRLTVEFNERVSPGTAQDTFSYTVTGSAGPLELATATLSANGTAVTLMLMPGTPLAPGQEYTVTVTGVQDLSENIISENNTAVFQSWVPTACGGVIFEVYNTGGGNAVSVLTSHPSYPDSPTERLIITTGFDSRGAYADDTHEGYGARMRGLFIPPQSGNWKFYLRADDGAEVWFNPSGPSASGRIRIAQQAGYIAGAFAEEAPGARTSAPYSLAAGQAYYLEALYKEGTGGDYGQVAAKLESDPTPADALVPIPGDQLGSPAAPAGIVGEVQITQQPTDQSVAENSTATFSVGAMNALDAPICYQWLRDGADIPGAIGPSYSFRPTLADTGARFSVRVAVIGDDDMSQEATLTVSTDTDAPTVMGAFSSITGTNVTVRFSESVEASSAQETFSYQIAGFTVVSATLQPNSTDVLLGIDPKMAVGSEHELTIQDVQDLAGNAMAATNIAVKAHVLTYGTARFDLFLGLPVNTVILSDLTSSPKYPHSPDITRFKDILELNTADEFEGYGTRMSGFLIPPVTGDYTFFMHSDDNGELWLSTDEDPGNVTMIAREPVWANRREWVGEGGGGGRLATTPPANTSNPIALMASQLYYFEALMKEGGGGDNLGVTWQIPGGPAPVNGQPSAITGEFLASLADPMQQTPTGPKVKFSVSGDQLTFSWNPPTGFRLQRKSSLGAPGGWTDVPNGATSPVTVTIGEANEFFQLVQ